jgi:hypothetical protein
MTDNSYLSPANKPKISIMNIGAYPEETNYSYGTKADDFMDDFVTATDTGINLPSEESEEVQDNTNFPPKEMNNHLLWQHVKTDSSKLKTPEYQQDQN